ncbi:MAG: hypothetical protein JRN15_19490, partial [Nitrososphaerota archaeon]|nr:hypothetical protein [Nitrososphaerota archaeon]
DSSGILSYIDPYPIIFKNTTSVYDYSALSNVIYSAGSSHLGTLLTSLHVRYVIIELNYSKNYFMTHSPNRVAWNISMIMNRLNASFGIPNKVGSFYVYLNLLAKPFVSLQSNISLITTPTYYQYLQFLTKLNLSANSLCDAIVSSVWSGQAIPNLTELTPISYSGLGQRLGIPAGTNVSFVLNNGDINSRLLGSNVTNSSVILNGMPLGSISMNNDYKTSMNSSNGTLYQETGTGYIDFLPWFPTENVVQLNFSYQPMSYNQRIYLYITNGAVNLSVQIIYLNTHFDIESTANTSGSSSYYAWNNTLAPITSLTGSSSITVFLNRTTLTSVLHYNGSMNLKTQLYFGLNNYRQSAGRNSSAISPTIPNNNSYTISLSVLGGFAAKSFEVLKQYPISYILFTRGNLSAISYSSVSISSGQNGDYSISATGMSSQTGYYLVESIPTEYFQNDWSVAISSAVKIQLNAYTFAFHIPPEQGVAQFKASLHLVNDVTTWLWFSVGEVAALSTIFLLSFVPFSRRFFHRLH